MSEVGQVVSFKAIDNICAHVNAECENGCGTKVRELLQQYFLTAPPAVWSREKPTEEGFYWMKPKHRPIRIVRVTAKTIASGYGGVECEWSGPLRPPVEGKG